MKKYLIVLLIALGCNMANSQILYTEDFNVYTTGNVGTDITGTIPGKGGWYTKSVIGGFSPNPAAGTNTDYQIIAEPNKGNAVEIPPMNLVGDFNRFLYRTDLKTYWQQRTPGNNVFKLAFDVFCTSFDDETRTTIHFFSDEGRLVSVGLHDELGYICRDIGNRNHTSSFPLGLPFMLNKTPIQLPVNTWTTLEVYIDYNNNKIYFSIPSINYTVVENAGYNFDLSGIEHDDSPVQLMFFTAKNADVVPVNATTTRFDNINISAQNTVPVVTVGITEQLVEKFNIYPNPATNVVNISNSDNMPVQQITVYDVNGRQLSSQTFQNETEIQLNVTNLASGTYMLHLQTKQGTAVKKLVKK
ncbi:T9SS type A sorting domain-containing protein [Flavobacterium sp. CBA20B-1]|uniref:T9SS type A sorting domain-containing protein n=1 Tax=unclassified Flavobacterium TaxID=196869 RepID=UPI002223FF6F|nr:MULTISPECIES: T9SS type A sorting domain-containing protein [unclassified Flavobacterium]WCM41489.1 T9SS type A sorting domain-containing protein [Flavobacterium sp. CBA20B-1]